MKEIHVFRKFLRKTGENRVAEESVPEAVKSSVKEKYHVERPIGWVGIHKHSFGAFFKDRAWFKFARFSDTGEWQETMVMSPNNDLPDVAKGVLDGELGGGYKVLEVSSIVKQNKQFLYQVHISHKNRHYDCLIDKSEGSMLERRVFDPGDEKLPEAESLDFEGEMEA